MTMDAARGQRATVHRGATGPRPTQEADGGGGREPVRRLGAVRRARIVQLLRGVGYVHAADLSDSLGVSEMTIRRDLDALARAGLGTRVWGGLVMPGFGVPDGPRSDDGEQRLRLARQHLRRAELALDRGQLPDVGHEVRAVLRLLHQDVEPGAASSER